MSLLLLLFVSLLFSGCAGFEPKTEKTAEELAAEGIDAFESGDYALAIETFGKLKDWYPFSKYAILAELKVADAHFHRKKYDDAILEYQSFESLHPLNEAVPYVIFQIGMCHFLQMETVDRDQSSALKAHDAFQRLLDQHPNSKYAGPAAQKAEAALKNMAGHEFYVGEYYFKTGHYKSALGRFKRILTDFPDVGYHKKALGYITRCETALADEDLEKKEEEPPEKQTEKSWLKRIRDVF